MQDIGHLDVQIQVEDYFVKISKNIHIEGEEQGGQNLFNLDYWL